MSEKPQPLPPTSEPFTLLRQLLHRIHEATLSRSLEWCLTRFEDPARSDYYETTFEDVQWLFVAEVAPQMVMTREGPASIVQPTGQWDLRVRAPGAVEAHELAWMGTCGRMIRDLFETVIHIESDNKMAAWLEETQQAGLLKLLGAPATVPSVSDEVAALEQLLDEGRPAPTTVAEDLTELERLLADDDGIEVPDKTVH